MALFGGYCATIQGLLGRFEVENVLAKFLFYLNRFGSVCALSVYCFPMLSSHSPVVPFGRLHCTPRAVGLPLESALSLVSPMSLQAHVTHLRCSR